jgi:hypothetical protein
MNLTNARKTQQYQMQDIAQQHSVNRTQDNSEDNETCIK